MSIIGKDEGAVRRLRMPRLSNAPLRLATGAYILNSGITLFENRKSAAHEIHKTAQEAYPVLANVEPDQFIVLLAGVETVLGAALLAPVVRSRLAGLGLAAFSGGLLGMYWRNERFRRGPGDPRPSEEGQVLAKDVWMLGIALALILQRRPSPRSK